MKNPILKGHNNLIMKKIASGLAFILVILQLSLVSIPAANAVENSSIALTPILDLPFPFSKALINPTKPIVYLIDSDRNKRVYSANFETKQISSLNFDGIPVKLAVENGELYVLLQKSNIDPLIDVSATGSIVIINTSTFTVTDEIPLDFVPKDMIVDKDSIYILPYNTTDHSLQTYSRRTKQKTASGAEIEPNSQLVFNPKLNRLYSFIGTKSVVVSSYDVSDDGVRSNNLSRMVFGVTNLPKELFVSADGEYIFTTDSVVLDANLNQVTSLPNNLFSMAFNSASNDFYVADRKDPTMVKAYNYDYDNPYSFRTFKQNAAFTAHGYVHQVFYQNGKLIALTTGGSHGSMAVESSDVSNSPVPYQPDPLSPVIPVNFKPTDSLIDPNRPVIYLTDNTNRRIYAVNYKTKMISFIQLALPPEKMAFDNNELYVTLMQRDNQPSLRQDSSGTVAIIDPDHFKLTKEIPLSIVPDDIAVSGDFFYIAAYTIQGIEITSFSRSTGQMVDHNTQFSEVYQSNLSVLNSHIYYPGERMLDSQGFPQLLISNDKLYMVEEDLYTRSIINVYVYSMNNGVFGSSHDLMSRNKQDSEILLLTDDFRLSPDGQYLLNGIGNVFDKDLNYLTRLDSPFTDTAFDPIYHRFYTANTQLTNNPFPRAISVYDNNMTGTGSFTKVDTLSFLSREVSYMAYQDRNIIAVSQNDFPNYLDNQYFIQIIPVAQTIQLPTTPAVHRETRFDGYDQYETAAKIAQSGWKETSDSIILSAGMRPNLIDAMAAGPLASLLNAPILLTDENNSLNPYTKAEITRLKPSKAYITSGTAVIKPAVISELKSMGITPIELGGYDQYETSVNIANKMQSLGADFTKIVVVAGWVSPADALSIGSIASAQKMPVLATTKNQLPPKVTEYLDGIQNLITDSYVIGGTAVVSENVKNSLPGHQERYAGTTKYDTNLEVLKNFANDLKYHSVYVANGETLVDALTGVPLAARDFAPIILTNKTMDNAILEYAKLNFPQNLSVLGGQAVVTNNVITQLSSHELLTADNRTLGGTDSNNPGQFNKMLVITGDNLTLQNTNLDYSLYIQGNNDSLNNVTVQGTIFIDLQKDGNLSLHNVRASNIVVLSGTEDRIQFDNVKANIIRWPPRL
ncbi:cell wall-binding repeat-containing protein [Desulfosporosinus sp. HMP52]|uniref:cell wall-binding repeat-containing protein n=1 Tax=Desulfosporosinus sp. HMP52 TaxID=1487923 RepID=UPI00068E73CD|nr:cell wall-binding repeat-containing protein [Desulfosporosinus sp. HMP52]